MGGHARVSLPRNYSTSCDGLICGLVILAFPDHTYMFSGHKGIMGITIFTLNIVLTIGFI